MSSLNLDFDSSASALNFRELAVARLSNDEKSPFASLYAAAINIGFDPRSDVLPVAAIVWDKKADRFSIAFPENGEHILHRLRVHFFHEGYAPVKDSGAFKPIGEVLESLPQLKGKEYTTSAHTSDRIIDNLAHNQLLAIVKSAQLLNASAKEVLAFQKKVAAKLKNIVDDAFVIKKDDSAQEAQPIPQTAQTSPSKQKKNPKPKQSK